MAVEHHSSPEVAQQLGMTIGAVRQAKYKVLRRLRQELGDAE
jgi:DNA-directed RNA polymerase specialized sigma24 family protein